MKRTFTQLMQDQDKRRKDLEAQFFREREEWALNQNNKRLKQKSSAKFEIKKIADLPLKNCHLNACSIF